MRKTLLAFITLTTAVCVQAQPGPGSVTLDHVDGLNAAGRIIPGEPVTFHIRYSNNSVNVVYATSNGFRLHGDGTTIQWQPISGQWSPSIPWGYYFDSYVYMGIYSGTGSGADTIGFAGQGVVGLPVGFSEIAVMITTEVDAAYAGATLCLDSCWFSGYTWRWGQGMWSFFPSWDGPHCFAVFPAGCCVIRGDVDHSGVEPIDIADLVYLVDFMFNAGPVPDCFYRPDVSRLNDAAWAG